jgi:hypothetical protein
VQNSYLIAIVVPLHVSNLSRVLTKATAYPAGRPHRGRMGARADSTVPSCHSRLQLSLGSCGVAGTLPRCSNDFGHLLWACTQPQTRQPFANWSTAVLISCHIIQRPSVRCFCPYRNLRHTGIDSLPRVCARPGCRSSLPIKAPEDLSWLVSQRPT